MKIASFLVYLMAIQTCFAGYLFAKDTKISPEKSRNRGAWKIQVSRSEMTDVKNVMLYLEATKSIQSDFGPQRPDLILCCEEGELEAYINTGFILESGDYGTSPVRIRWDDSEPVSDNWTISTDHDAVFSRDPLDFIFKELVSAKRLRFQFQPFNSGPKVADFNVIGLSEHLSKLDNACPSAGIFNKNN